MSKLSPPSGSRTDWQETALHQFRGGRDGSHPLAQLLMGSDGTLYGTTTEGGDSTNCPDGCGTVFAITP